LVQKKQPYFFVDWPEWTEEKSETAIKL